jgi:hypothetical protein
MKILELSELFAGLSDLATSYLYGSMLLYVSIYVSISVAHRHRHRCDDKTPVF